MYIDGSLVVVGKTFEEVVPNKDQDVFMLLGCLEIPRGYSLISWQQNQLTYPVLQFIHIYPKVQETRGLSQ